MGEKLGKYLSVLAAWRIVCGSAMYNKFWHSFYRWGQAENFCAPFSVSLKLFFSNKSRRYALYGVFFSLSYCSQRHESCRNFRWDFFQCNFEATDRISFRLQLFGVVLSDYIIKVQQRVASSILMTFGRCSSYQNIIEHKGLYYCRIGCVQHLLTHARPFLYCLSELHSKLLTRIL